MSVGDPTTEAANEGATDGPSLRLFSLTSLVIASMIGAGVYTTSGFAIADLGDPWLVLAAWMVGGLIAICGALGYGQLVNRLCENGGEYLYLSRFVHPVAGSIAGWVSFLAGFTGAGAFAASTLETYAWPNFAESTGWPAGSLAVVVIVVATCLHAFRTQNGVISQNIIVGIKLCLLCVFILIAFQFSQPWQGDTSFVWQKTRTQFALLPFATSVMWISLSYSGFNAAIYVTEESRGGSREVARSMWLATSVVTVFYLLLNAVFLFAPSQQSILAEPQVATIAAKAIGGSSLSMLVRVTICVGLASSVSSVLMAGPRVYAKMAREGAFPKFFHAENPPPTRSILLQGFAMCVVVLVAKLPDLLSYLGLTLSLTAAATVATLFRPWRLDWRLLLPACYVAATLIVAGISAWNRPAQAITTGITLIIGVAAYLWASRKTKTQPQIDPPE